MTRKKHDLALVLWILLVFVAAMALRWKIFSLPIREGDEQVYKALVEYVLAGQPYSMQNHPLVTEGELPASVYAWPVFYHPPGGVWFFSIFAGPFRLMGLKLAQLVCFAITYFSLIGSALLLTSATRIVVFAYAPLAAFTPILSHISLRVWIDNPKVAFLSAFVFFSLAAVKKRISFFWWVAAFFAGIATFTKVDSLLAIPLYLALAAYEAQVGDRRQVFKISLLVALLCFGIGLLWSLHAGTLFRAPSLPTEESFAKSMYTFTTTVGTTPSQFVGSFFKVMSTIIPGALLFLLFRRTKKHGNFGSSGILLLILLAVLIEYVALTAFGYAKLLRYLCSGVPAFTLFFAAILRESMEMRTRTLWFKVLLAIFCFGYLLEIGQGVHILANKPRIALIEPLF